MVADRGQKNDFINMKKEEVKLSILIIAKDEEKMIGDCLKSLTGLVESGSEVIVIDTGSKDKTILVAKRYGAKVYKYLSGRNYSDWRNFALSKAKGKWIFYIDADERVTSELEKEIIELINNNEEMNLAAMAVPRRNFIFGKEFKHSGQYPDYQKRFFLRSVLGRWTGDVHEEPNFAGEMKHFKNPFVHQKDLTLSQMMDKTNKWSEYEARLMFRAAHPPMNMWRFFTAVIREFWKRQIREMAFLDGRLGIIYAQYQVFSKFVSYAKLWELQNKT